MHRELDQHADSLHQVNSTLALGARGSDLYIKTVDRISSYIGYESDDEEDEVVQIVKTTEADDKGLLDEIQDDGEPWRDSMFEQREKYRVKVQ